MHNRAEFLAAAVSEAQTTIRAIDVKVSALLIAVLVPVPLLGSISHCLAGIYMHWPYKVTIAMLAVFSISWIFAVFCYVRAIGAIDSPASHVLNNQDQSGGLYSPGLFKLSWLDTFLNRSNLQSSIDSVDHLSAMPSGIASIEKELAFEHLKLAYIRDIKLQRLKWGVRLSAISVLIGVGLFVLSQFYIDQCQL